MTSPTTRTRAFEVSRAFKLAGPPSGFSSNGVVLDAVRFHHLRIIEVAAVEDGGRLDLRLDGGEVRTAELLPLGDDRERVGTLEGVERGIDDAQTVLIGENAARLVRRYRIVGAHHGGTGADQVG